MSGTQDNPLAPTATPGPLPDLLPPLTLRPVLRDAQNALLPPTYGPIGEALPVQLQPVDHDPFAEGGQ
jgi:hypothetical protein